MTDSVRRYLADRSLRHRVLDDGSIATTIALGGADSAPRLRIAIAHDPAAGGLHVLARPTTAVPRAGWTSAVWSCNVWNNGHRIPRARLSATDWERDDTATVVLDGWLPGAAAVDPDAVRAYLDAVLRGAALFLDSLSGARPTATPSTRPGDGPYRL